MDTSGIEDDPIPCADAQDNFHRTRTTAPITHKLIRRDSLPLRVHFSYTHKDECWFTSALTCAIYVKRLAAPNLEDEDKEESDVLPDKNASFEDAFNLWSVVKNSYKVGCRPILEMFVKEYFGHNRDLLVKNQKPDTLFIGLAGS